MHMNIRRMNDRKHHKRSKRGSNKVGSFVRSKASPVEIRVEIVKQPLSSRFSFRL